MRVLRKKLRVVVWLLLAMGLACPAAGSAERDLAPIAADRLWFKPVLAENNDARCQAILADTQQFFLTEESLDERYGWGRSDRNGDSGLAGMNRIELSGAPLAQADKALHLSKYRHHGCGGACEQYQIVATALPESDSESLEQYLGASPPPARWNTLYGDSAQGGSYWLLQPEGQESLLAYRLNDDGSWKRACVVKLRPDLSSDPVTEKALSALDELRRIVADDLMRGAGSCGSMATNTRWKRKFSEQLPEIFFRPWVLRAAVISPEGEYGQDMAGLADWALTGLSEHAALQAYHAQLEQTVVAVSRFHQAKFRWNKQAADDMARLAITGAVDGAIRFYEYHPFASADDRLLRETILGGESLDEIRRIPLDRKKQPRYGDGSETVLDVAVSRPDVLAYLLGQGLDPNEMNPFDKTPLMYAAQANQPEAVAILLKAGAEPNARTTLPEDDCTYTLETSGMTALHYAVRYATPEVVRLLLDHGALPFLEAEKRGYQDIREAPLVWLERYAGADALERNPNMPAERVAEVRGWLSERPADLAALANKNTLKAEQLHGEGDFSGAYQSLSLALAIDPRQERALDDMALVALKQGEVGQSAAVAQQLIKSASTAKVRARAWFNQGLACEKGGNTFYNGSRYCRESVLYAFYMSLRTERTLARVNKLREVLAKAPSTACDIPARNALIHFKFEADPGSGEWARVQKYYVLHEKGKEPRIEELAWRTVPPKMADSWLAGTRIVPEKLVTLDLGDLELTVFQSDKEIQFPAELMGQRCMGKYQ